MLKRTPTLTTLIFFGLVLFSGQKVSAQTHINGTRFLHYDVISQTNLGQISGKGVLSWQADQAIYRSTLTVKALFLTLLNSASEGRVGPVLIPEKYVEKLFRRDLQELSFSRQKNKIYLTPAPLSNNGLDGRTGITMRPNEQDNLSLIWQLRARVVENGAALGARHEFVMSGPTDIFELQFKGLGVDKVSALGGIHTAWHVQRVALANPQNAAESKQFDFWFAPELEGLPVKIQYQEPNGDRLSFMLTKISTEAGQ